MDNESKITLTAVNKREWPSGTLKALNTFRLTQQTLCDIVLKGEDLDSQVSIPAHRCVLAANSDYFHAMFTSGLAESRKDHREVTIQGVDTITLSLIVEFLYTGSCRLQTGTIHQIMDILAAAMMLQVDELSNSCSAYLERCLDSENALDLWLFAERYGIIELADQCKRFVQTYFRVISARSRVLDLQCEEMASLLGLDEINSGGGAKEEALVDLVGRWLGHCGPTVQDQDLIPVLSKVCWTKMAPDIKAKFKEKLSDSVTHLSPNVESIIDNPEEAVFNRIFYDSVCVIGGLQNSRAGRRSPQTCSFEVTDIDTRTGAVLRKWTKPRGFHSSHGNANQNHYLPFRGQLYAMYTQSKVGQNSLFTPAYPVDDKREDDVCVYEANIINANLKVVGTKSWDCESVWWDLIDKHNYVRAVDESEGAIYLCGCSEQRDGVISKRVFRLDMESYQCTELTSLPFGRSHHRAIVVNGELFVFGGIDRLLTPLSIVLKYDFKENSWEEVSPMHQPRIDGAFVSVDGRIYATGGSTTKFRSRNMEVYNPLLDIWTTLSPMSMPRVNHGLVAVGGYLFAIGGQSYSGENGGARNVQRTVERYCIADDRWEPAWEMAECRWGMTAFTL